MALDPLYGPLFPQKPSDPPQPSVPSTVLPSVPLYGPLSSLQYSHLSPLHPCVLSTALFPLNITLYPLAALCHLYVSLFPLRPAVPATALCLSAALYLL
jgi:hypothetical protein